MPELSLNLANLEIENPVISAEDERRLLTRTLSAVKHGLIDSGASCCQIGQPHGFGNCAAMDDLTNRVAGPSKHER